MRVVFAIQAPTLLNRLARSKHWQLEVADLGDAAVAERALLTAPRYHSGAVDAVFVTTPAQLWAARFRWPAARLVWCAHNGRPEVVAAEGKSLPLLTFSRRTAALHHAANPQVRIAAVRPFYEPEPIWKWEPNKAWLMLSRPKTRQPDLPEANRYVLERSGVRCLFYGEGQPDGFLEDPRLVMRSCSAYLSALPHWAGFGLSQHECFARGVPVVCSRWGDSVEEISPSYRSLDDDLDVQATQLKVLSAYEGIGKQASQLGLTYIAERRTLANMDLEVERALDVLL